MTNAGRRILAWLTDFGSSDGYVAAMKATALSICPDVTLVDISHEIAPGDVDQAGFVLSQCYEYFPHQTIFICVVDPGVGSARNILLVETGRHIFIAPDNGLLKFVFQREAAAVVSGLDPSAVSQRPVSATFHGRDIMAPAAGQLARGTLAAALSQPFAGYVRGQGVVATRQGTAIHGNVIHIDRFGNCISNIPGVWLAAGAVAIRFGAIAEQVLRHFYGEVQPGEPICLTGSHGYLELAVRDGHAAEQYGIRRGDPVSVIVKIGST